MAPFLILHGLQGSPPPHWQAWLAERLEAAGETVAFPTLPDPDAPDLAAWRDALDAELEALAAPPVVVCHSLGCVLWMHHAAWGRPPAERVLLVAPPSAAGVPELLAPFFPVPLPRLPGARLVCADDDSYCPEGAQAVYPGLPADVLPGGGHLNPEAGFGPWPAVEAWCRSGAVPVTR
jgi:predicted alpha/beta hydrolase family esterase